MRQEGFTLLHLLIGLALAGVLTHLAAPALQALLLGQRRQLLAEELASGLRSARVEAIVRQREVWVQAIDDDWSLGWRLWADDSGRGRDDPDNPVLLERAGSGRLPVVGNHRLRTRARFIPQGWPANTGGGPGNGTLHVCDEAAPVSHWRVIMANSGRVRLESGPQAEPLCTPA
jgi:type IV fimbrial biogenesis protein FimT